MEGAVKVTNFLAKSEGRRGYLLGVHYLNGQCVFLVLKVYRIPEVSLFSLKLNKELCTTLFSEEGRTT